MRAKLLDASEARETMPLTLAQQARIAKKKQDALDRKRQKEAERERALIADGNRHARVGNQYDARRTPQYREDAAYARKVAQEEDEDVGDRDIAYEDRDPYKVGLSDSGEYKDQTTNGEYQVGEYKISDYDCAEYKSVYDK